MTSMLVDPLHYPLSEEGARYLASATFGHVIEGKVVPSISGETFAVHDPATGLQVARAAAGGPEDVDAAVASARRAFDDGRWRFLAPLEQERRLRRLSALLTEHAALLTDLDVLDGGVLKMYSRFLVQFAVDATDYYAGWPTKIAGTIPRVPRDVAVYATREPLGVCAVIVPWNAPSAIVVGVVMALACGNSVVLKPAEQTPMTAVLLGQLCVEAGIPPGVLNVVQGTGESAGAALATHPGVDKISFTGSAETGRIIQAAAAPTLKRVTLELGGKSPFIVFADAEVEPAAMGAMYSVWGGSGQVCTAGSRLLVQRPLHDAFIDAVVGASKDLTIGPGFDPSSQLGPLISEAQLERVQRYVALGVAEGAQLVLGGSRHGDVGWFHEPTVFTGVRNEMTIAQEEIFGPVMSVIPFDTEEEAYEIANAVEFGLAAGVWTTDLARAHRASRALHAGTVWVNTYQEVNPTVSYGGVKQSGYGRTLGEESIGEFTTVKSTWMKVSR